ncbi:MAG: DUF1997 domain-containing protein [Cyanobium sp.]
MRLEQRRFTPIPLTPAATPEQLHLFLAKPLRPLRGLLDPSRLQRADPGGDTYRYTSRPYGVAGWTLQPRVLLRARYAEGELLIEQLESRVQGLGAWQERLSFGLEARIRSGEDSERGSAVLEAEARVWAELPAAAVVVAGPVLKLGLQQLLDRLERRCQLGLRGRAEAWLERRG